MRRTDLVFFLSGVAALVYESAWARLLARRLGSHAQSTALVLAIFMLGLGLGAVLAAPLAARVSRPGRLYAALELFIGLWACAFPWAMQFLGPVDGLGPGLALASTFLLAPTLAMGATAPVMARLVLAERQRLGEATARFYGVNTLGACVGALASVAFFMPVLGLHGALWGAATLTAVCAALGLGLSAPRVEVDEPRAPATRGIDALPLACAAAFGAASLALEVVMTRVLISVTGASVYAFALVLAVFLGGIALGSFQAREWLATRARALVVLERCAIGALLAAALGVVALRWQLDEPDLFAGLDNRLRPDASPLALWASHAIVAALALLGPAVAFGAALPACAALASERAHERAGEVLLGRVYLSNTLGALCGALFAGFVGLEQLGQRGAFLAALAPLALVVVLAQLRARERPWLRALCLVPLAWAVAPAAPPEGRTVLYSASGRCENVSVEDNREPGGESVRAIRINGKVEASTAPVDMRLQRLLAYIPGLLHGQVKHAAVIGLGAGTTSGALLDLPQIESIEVFELEPRVADAARLFADWNGGVVDDRRVSLRFVDGRHALARSERRYDLITSDPVHIWTRGSSDLYTLEYFRSMSERLAPRGIASQWLSLYELSTDDLKVLCASWCGAFEYVAAYLTAYDLALIGANEPWSAELSRAALPAPLPERLAEIGILGAHELAALEVADARELRAWIGATPPMRDVRPILEFRSPLSFLAGYSVEVLRWSGRPEVVERLPSASHEYARWARTALHEFLDALPSGRSAAAAAYGQTLIRRSGLGAPASDG